MKTDVGSAWSPVPSLTPADSDPSPLLWQRRTQTVWQGFRKRWRSSFCSLSTCFYASMNYICVRRAFHFLWRRRSIVSAQISGRLELNQIRFLWLVWSSSWTGFMSEEVSIKSLKKSDGWWWLVSPLWVLELDCSCPVLVELPELLSCFKAFHKRTSKVWISSVSGVSGCLSSAGVGLQWCRGLVGFLGV